MSNLEPTPKLYDGVKITPRMRVEMACAWIAQDYGRKGRFLRLVHLCERAQARGEVCIRRGDLYRLAQETGMDITLCKEFRFDNNIWSPLSRYLLMFRPKLAGCIHPKKCDIDDPNIDMEAMWHELVEPRTMFMARTWQEAVEAYEAKDVTAA